jgi:GTP-binding protein
MKLPTVTIAGRQNVGKSTLFNYLIGERRAIVDPIPGLTRDVISHSVTRGDITFRLQDMPGLDLAGSSELSDSILSNAMEQLDDSDVVLFLMEYPSPDSYDFELAEQLRRLDLPVVAAVNKMDSNERLAEMNEFYRLGLQEFIPISAMTGFNIPLLLETLGSYLEKGGEDPGEPDIRISLVGRPNAGKSTLLNSMVRKERAIVSEIPGTTRDAVDEDLKYYGKHIRLIDTAGIRKKSRIKKNVDYYSTRRSQDAIRRSDVVIHLLDATTGVTETDKKISDIILDAGKPIIIAINKWDAIERDTKTFQQFREKVIFHYYRAADFPIISISARTGQRTGRLLEEAFRLHERASRTIDTPELNRVLKEVQSTRRIPQLGDKIRIYYATQVKSSPPVFRLFVNRRDYFRKDVIRYITKSLQDSLDLHGVPVRIEIEDKKEQKGRRG